MTRMANGDDPGAGPDLAMTRVFDAPRGQVFRAWTEPERLKRWWGPRGHTMPVCEIDLRPGGVFFHFMRSPEGHEVFSRGVFREVVVPERIVVTDSFADTEGNVVPPTHYGMGPDWPVETLMTVTFEEDGGATRVTVRYAGVPPGADRDGSVRGWSESLDRLAEHLAKA
jgi:uncharacterized protein YndB with AHSA1/START domain